MKETTNRGPRLNIWLSQADKTEIQERAKSAGLTVTDYMIRVGKGEVVRADPKQFYSRDELAIFRNIGANLNQLAGHANTKKGFWNERKQEELDGLIMQLRNLLS